MKNSLDLAAKRSWQGEFIWRLKRFKGLLKSLFALWRKDAFQQWKAWCRKWHRAMVRVSSNWHVAQLNILRRYLKFVAPSRPLIAIVLIEHMGDIVACEPVARYVRAQFPDAYTVWCVRKPYAELVKNHSDVNRALVMQCLAEAMNVVTPSRFDAIVNLHVRGRECRQCGVILDKTAPNSHITLENFYDYGSILSSFAQSAGLPALTDAPQLTIPVSAERRVDHLHLPRKYVVVHCKSNEVSKDWPGSKWKELMTKLDSILGISIVEVGLSSMISDHGSSQPINLCGKLSILETAEVIRRARLFVGVDSGPGQIANAVNTPGVILIGPYKNFRQYSPYSGNYARGLADIIYHDGAVSEISVGRVYDSVLQKLNLGGDGNLY